jgi:hypothetical protein
VDGSHRPTCLNYRFVSPFVRHLDYWHVSSITRGRIISVIKITYVNQAAEVVGEAAEYCLMDGWYILKDDAGKEVGRAQAKEVRSIRKVSEEEQSRGFSGIVGIA